MKYGVLFSAFALILAYFAFASGGWFLLLLWPSFSFGVVGMGYLSVGHRVFGKRHDGAMRPDSVVILLPFLLYVWGVWHVARVVSREPPHNKVTDELLVGRRLLVSELPAGIQTVVDLTCEFPESRVAEVVPNYISAPMLDGSALSPQSLAGITTRLESAEIPIFIHCAQGHGRTGVVAALFLIARGEAGDPESAIALLKTHRPLVRINRVQMSALEAAVLLNQTADRNS